MEMPVNHHSGSPAFLVGTVGRMPYSIGLLVGGGFYLLEVDDEVVVAVDDEGAAVAVEAAVIGPIGHKK